MRIVAGKYRSRIINAPSNDKTRPTADKTRESIFNIINMYINNANVLDVFSGSGALGIEAISRGAKHATFIDKDDIAISTIKENINNLKIDNYQIIQDDYHIISTIKEKFDVILLDPPYALDCFDEIFKLLNDNDLVSDYGVIVYESDSNHQLKDEYVGYRLKVKKYGIAYVNVLYKDKL